MPSKKAGLITVQFTAGTGQFVGDVEKAKATVREFGTSVKGMNSELSHTVTGVQATSGALRVLEGGISNNLRAAERFTANVLGLGPALQAAFPVVGAIAFAGILTKLGEDASKFYAQMRDYPAKMAGAFVELNSGLRLTNDRLDLTNAKLENQLAKLSGKRENGLKVALVEAKIAADNLADSLDKDLSALNKLLEEQKATLTEQFFGRISDQGLREELGGKTGFGGFRKDIRETTEAGRAQIEAAAGKNDQAGVDKAIEDLKEKLQKKFKDMLDVLDRQIAAFKPQTIYKYGPEAVGQNASANSRLEAERAQAHLEELQYARSNVAQEAASVPKQVDSYRLNKAVTAAQTGRDNAKLDRPFEDRMKAMNAQLEGVKTKMAAIGSGEAGENIAKAFADAQKEIEEVNKALGRINPNLKLTKAVGPVSPTTAPPAPPARTEADKGDQEGQIRYRQYLIATAEAEAAWKTKLDSATDSIENRIRSQRELTAAIGQGYEATRRASVETSVMGAVGKNYGDEEWMKKNAADVSGLRSQYGKEYDTQHAEEIGKAIYALQQQIDLEKSLAKVQAQGAEAVRLVTLAYRLKKIALDNDTEAAKKLMTAEIAQYTAERDNRSAAELAKINEETAATERLTAAVFKGAEAARLAALENKYAQMQHAGAAPEVIAATRSQDEAAYQEKISTEAAKLATNYSDALDHISQLTAKLQEAKATQGDTLGIENALRNLENERLHILAEQALQMGRAQDGVRAFFLDMQQSAVKASTVIYDALHSALDKASNELANLLTGQKTSWSKLFLDLGHQAEASAIKGGLQTILGKLAKPDPNGQQTPIGKIAGALGIGAASKPDGSTADRALWVRLADSSRSPIQNTGGGPGSIPGVSKQGNVLFGNGGLLGTGGVPRISEPSGNDQSSGGDTQPKEYDQYGFRKRPDVPSVFLPPFPSQDIGLPGTGKIGDTVGNGDTLAGVGGVPIASGGLGSLPGPGPDGSPGNPFNVVLGQMGGFDNKPVDFGPNQAKPQQPNFLQKWGPFIGQLAGTVVGALAGGGGGGGGTPHVSSTVSYPGLATGGPVKSGTSYIVGEKGPEYFTSAVNGHIVDHETTKRMAAAGMLPPGIKVPGVSAKPVKSSAFTDGARGNAAHLPTAAPKRLTPRADGGDVSAGDSYIVGERGAETFMPNLAADQGSRRTEASGGNAYYTIDARGTDPNLVEQRVRGALAQVHKSAIATSIQGNVERSKRVPG